MHTDYETKKTKTARRESVRGHQTDLTFFTNDKHQTLLDRFKTTLADTLLFDVLVGYFRSSGFYQLHDSIEPIAKTRILVGLGLDDESYRAVSSYQTQGVLDFESHSNENFPIKKHIDSFFQYLVSMSIYIKELLKDFDSQKLLYSYFDQLANGLVYELYFPDDIKAANKQLLPHLGELAPITDTMTEEEKLAGIQREFDRLYDPRHPVRNHLETLDSVGVVHTIREALKK